MTVSTKGKRKKGDDTPLPLVSLEDLTAREVPLEQLVAGENPRQDSSWETKELAKSIKVHGVLQPIRIRPMGDGRFEIVAGRRRYEAAKLAGLRTIPATAGVATDEDAYVQALVENLQRADLPAIDEAKAFQKLISEYGLSQEALGKRLGRSQPYISNKMRLLELEPEVQEAVISGQISEAHAKAIISLPAERQKRLVEEITERKMPVAELAGIVRREKDDEERKARWEEAQRLAASEMLNATKDVPGERVIVFHNKDLADAAREAGHSVQMWNQDCHVEPVYECDCDSVMYNQYGSQETRLVRVCIVAGHYEQHLAGAKAERDEKRKANKAILTEARKALGTALRKDGEVSSRLLLYLILGDPTNYGYTDNAATKFVKRHKGNPNNGQNGLWDVIEGLKASDVTDELVKHITSEVVWDVFDDGARYEVGRDRKIREWLVAKLDLNPEIVWGGHDDAKESAAVDDEEAAAENAVDDEPTVNEDEAYTEKRERDPAQIQDEPGEEDKEGPSTKGNPELTPVEQA